MQIIRFTYANTEIRNSVFVMLFFKMMGVYVQERFYDMGITLKNRIREFLSDGEEPLDLNRDRYDMELFLAVNKEQAEEFSRYDLTDRTLLLIPVGMPKEAVGDHIGKKKILFSDNKKIIFSLIDGMLENEIISKDTAEEFRGLAQFFINKRMADLLIATKCFFNPREKSVYNNYYEEYREAAGRLFEILYEQDCHWGDEQNIHLQFAALNIAYEGNAYCRRNYGPILYSTEGLIKVCKMLLENEEIRFFIGNSLNLLLANIYDNLTQSDRAYDYYLSACNEYNAFAYYKKALIFMDSRADYELTEKYLKKCLNIYPEYIRAWYTLGLCYSHQEKWEQAQQAWEYLKLILRQKRQEHVLSAMETEHLFLAALSSGKMKQEMLMDFEGALYEYMYAKEVYEEIEDTKFYSEVGMQTVEDRSIEHMKEQLFINVVYSKIVECYLQMGDMEHANEFSQKIF